MKTSRKSGKRKQDVEDGCSKLEQAVPKRVKAAKRQFKDSFFGLFITSPAKAAESGNLTVEIRDIGTGHCIASREFSFHKVKYPLLDPSCSRVFVENLGALGSIWEIKSDTVLTKDGRPSVRPVFDHCGTRYLDVDSVREIESDEVVAQSPFKVSWRFYGSSAHCCFSGDDSKLVFSEYASSKIVVWDISTKIETVQFNEHRKSFPRVSSPADRDVVVSLDDHDLIVWNYNAGTVCLKLEHGFRFIRNLAACSLQNAICVQHHDKLSFLDMDTGAVISQCNRYSVNWKEMVYSEKEGVLIQWANTGARGIDPSTGKVLFTMEVDKRVEELRSIACIPSA